MDSDEDSNDDGDDNDDDDDSAGDVSQSQQRPLNATAAEPLFIIRESINSTQWKDKRGDLSRRDGPLESFLVDVKHRVLVCRIDKNANTNLAVVMNRLNELDSNDLGASQPEHIGYGLEKLNSILHNKTWRKMVVLRDPMTRLLSGYISKCEKHEDSPCVSKGTYHYTDGCDKDEMNTIPNGNCENFEKFTYVKKPVPFGRFVRKLKSTFPDDREAWADHHFNLHFYPQHKFCGGLHRTIGHYTHVGWIGTSLGKHVHSLIDAMRSDPTVPDLPPKFKISDLFPLQEEDRKRAPHQSHSTSKLRRYYTDPELIQSVVEMYRDDYAFLGLPLPDLNSLALQPPAPGAAGAALEAAGATGSSATAALDGEGGDGGAVAIAVNNNDALLTKGK